MRELSILRPLTALEEAALLDPAVREVHRVVDAVLKPRALEDLLHGVPAGHPLHPAIVLVPAGTWISASVLDLVPGTARAARALVGVGVLAAAPAIVTGWADWARARRTQQRVGIVHAAANEIAWAVSAGSWLARHTGHDGLGRGLSLIALGLVGAGGYLGGHLGYRQALGANHAEAVVHRFPDGWHAVTPMAELETGVAERFEIAGEQLFVLRSDEHEVLVLPNHSSHLGEPLHEGVLGRDGGSPTVTTAGGSEFDLRTGAVVHGPATAPLHVFRVRVDEGLVQVHRP